MERYLRRNRLSELIDGLGMCCLLYLLASGWFVWLWGLNGASLLAGLALGTLKSGAVRFAPGPYNTEQEIDDTAALVARLMRS